MTRLRASREATSSVEPQDVAASQSRRSQPRGNRGGPLEEDDVVCLYKLQKKPYYLCMPLEFLCSGTWTNLMHEPSLRAVASD